MQERNGSDSEPSKSQETPGKLQEILEISQVFYRVGGNFRDVDSYSFMSKLKLLTKILSSDVS